MNTSENGRYFVDPTGAPIFWWGDTQWELLRSLSLEEALATVSNRKKHGFSFLQVMLLGVDLGPNIEGEQPFRSNNPMQPNERYFRHIDAVLAGVAEVADIALVLGVYHMRYTEGLFTEGNAREWARWLGRRYRDTRAIVWSMYPAARPEYVAICLELAAGRAAGDEDAHLITVHPDPAPATSSDLFHDEGWLAFNSIQTFKDVDRISSMTRADYEREPAKPAVMAEGAYEGGTEYGFEVTPLWVRRQAYYTYFAGGHHSYGHNDSWRLLPTWRDALDAPGATQMGILKRAFLSLPEWWELTPDNALLASGGRADGSVLTLAARHSSDRWAAVYAAAPSKLVVDTSSLRGSSYDARWIDPRDGRVVETTRAEGYGDQGFESPEGFEDGLLLLTESP